MLPSKPEKMFSTLAEQIVYRLAWLRNLTFIAQNKPIVCKEKEVIYGPVSQKFTSVTSPPQQRGWILRKRHNLSLVEGGTEIRKWANWKNNWKKTQWGWSFCYLLGISSNFPQYRWSTTAGSCLMCVFSDPYTRLGNEERQALPQRGERALLSPRSQILHFCD